VSIKVSIKISTKILTKVSFLSLISQKSKFKCQVFRLKLLLTLFPLLKMRYIKKRSKMKLQLRARKLRERTKKKSKKSKKKNQRAKLNHQRRTSLKRMHPKRKTSRRLKL